MNYYNEIKERLIDNEIYEKVKDYSKERNRVSTYYEVGKLLNDAGKHYGEGIIKEYSKKLSNEVGKKYSVRYLFDNEVNYYINQVISRNLSKRELQEIIKNREYDRLPEDTKKGLINKEENRV